LRRADAQYYAPVAADTEASAPEEVLFAGVPATSEGEALLWDSEAGDERWPDTVRFTRLVVRFRGGAPDAEALDPELALLLFVEDLAAPRARVTVADLLRQGGERPLNLRRLPGQRVRLLLQDPNGAWRAAPRIEVALSAAS
jgi:Ca-activated chloride channel family protein